jgi:GNAT superfamily N-acetyltransferase
MKKVSLQMAQRDDYQELAAWLVQMSQAPEQHCLHTWSGQSADGLQQQLLSYWDDSELCYIMALRNGQLVGAMGSEYDEALERGWLHGPHVATGDWELVAAQHLNYDFWLTPDERVVSGGGGCTLLGKEHETSFKQLYGTLFPAAYYSAERVIQMIGGSHQVVVAAQGEEVLGFAVVSAEGDGAEGEVQFFGVREDSRRQGHGRRLLLSAIDWLLDRAGVSRVCLNVGEELVHARGLYERVGFRLRFTGVGLEKAWTR